VRQKIRVLITKTIKNTFISGNGKKLSDMYFEVFSSPEDIFYLLRYVFFFLHHNEAHNVK